MVRHGRIRARATVVLATAGAARSTLTACEPSGPEGGGTGASFDGEAHGAHAGRRGVVSRGGAEPKIAARIDRLVTTGVPASSDECRAAGLGGGGHPGASAEPGAPSVRLSTLVGRDVRHAPHESRGER